MTKLVSFTRGNLTYQACIDNLNLLDSTYYFRLTDMLMQGQIAQSLLLFHEVLDKGFDGQHFITGLSEHMRSLLVCSDAARCPSWRPATTSASIMPPGAAMRPAAHHQLSGHRQRL